MRCQSILRLSPAWAFHQVSLKACRYRYILSVKWHCKRRVFCPRKIRRTLTIRPSHLLWLVSVRIRKNTVVNVKLTIMWGCYFLLTTFIFIAAFFPFLCTRFVWKNMLGELRWATPWSEAYSGFCFILGRFFDAKNLKIEKMDTY